MLDWLTTARSVATLDATAPPTLTAAVAIGAVAGVSTLLGHCAILFINRVRGVRFVASLLVGAAFLLLLHVLQALLLWLVLGPVTGRSAAVLDVVTVALAALAPSVLGFLVFVPHVGILVGHLLQAWQAVCLWHLVVVLQGTSWWRALAAAVLAWLLMQVASRLLGRPLGVVAGRVWSLVTGRPAMLEARDVLAGVPFVPVESEAAA